MSRNPSQKEKPGWGLHIFSFVPMLNWIAVVGLGAGWTGIGTVICGIAYGIVGFAFSQAAPFVWMITMAHYWIGVLRMTEPEKNPQKDTPWKAWEKPPTEPKRDVRIEEPETPYVPIELLGEPEKMESVRLDAPVVPAPEIDVKIVTEPVKMPILSTMERFLRDMEKYAHRTEAAAAFVPFGDEKPLYESMTQRQQAWYFHWRSQIRGGSYPDTDLGYIWLYTFELLSGQGWSTPSEGQDQLLKLWKNYRPRHPELDERMLPWFLDFAHKHSLPCEMPQLERLSIPQQTVLQDLLIDACGSSRPLKLPFGLVEALCEYQMTGSKFYKDGHRTLVEEAIPRVVALADAALLKKKNKSLLATYGPARTRKQVHNLFAGALCPDAGQRVEISVRGYTSSQKLRSYVNTLVRHGENVLRSICGYRGRLRGVELDPETAALVEAFLKKEYANAGKPEEKPKARGPLELDFDNIAMLRAQSDEVRDALEVSEDAQTPKEELTDLQAVMALMDTLTSEEAGLMDQLRREGWEMEFKASMEQSVAGINAKAVRWLACALLVREGQMLMAEDDYRDELTQIYVLKMAREESQKQEKPPQEAPRAGLFDPGKLSPALAELVAALSPLQQQTLVIVLAQEDVSLKLAALAEEALTMPEILIDEINEIANGYLDDILIDGFGEVPCVLEQYAEELRKAMT